MLKSAIGQNGALTTHAFLVGVEVEGLAQVDHIMHKLVDALTFVEGIGNVEIEHLGAVELMSELGADDPEADLPTPLKGMNES